MHWLFQKVEIVRKSYRTQLANAVQKIAGEYKVQVQSVTALSIMSDICVCIVQGTTLVHVCTSDIMVLLLNLCDFVVWPTQFSEHIFLL